MTTQPNAQPANAPTPAAAAAPSLNWQYPFPKKDHKPITDPQECYATLALMDDGFFPLGVNGFPHGGIHFGAAASRTLDLSGGVRCIADGEIVAYKIDGAYPHLNFTQSGKWAMYSTGFVLMRHRLTMPSDPKSATAQSADESHDVYCLYMHMADWATYLADGKLDRPWWWLGVDAHRVGNPARQDAARKGGSRGAAGSFVWTEPKPGKKAGQFTPGQHVGFLPEGSEVTIGEKRGKWGHITAITAGGMISPTDGGIFGEEDNPVPWKHDDSATPNAPVTPEGDWGWLYMPELQAVKEPVPVGGVVVPPKPISVKAGTLMGQLGEYHDYERSTPLPPVATRQLLHMEVFADDGFAAFLAKCRERAKSLPAEQRTTLVINKGARLVSPPQPPGMEVAAPGADLWVASPSNPKNGRWAHMRATRMYEGFVRIFVSDSMWIERKDANKPPTGMKVWKNFPLQLSAADATVGFTCSFPRARLEALPAEYQAIDADGKHWWYVEFGAETGQRASGWVCEQGHPGTQWQSPWAWPDFDIVDATGINLADAFKRNLVISGTADWKEQKEFEPSVEAVNGSALLLRLEQAISKLPERQSYGSKPDKKEGKPTVTAAKLQAAMRTAWLSDEMAHLILRYDSEWGGNMARWESITPLMRNARENWQCELQRIKKLQWWNDVKQVPGFPASSTVLHIHPVALVANFYRKSVVTVEMLRKIWPNPKVPDERLAGIAAEINENSGRYRLDTELRLTHFFAQVRQEAGEYCVLEEDLSYYTPSRLKVVFSYFRNHPAEAELYGYIPPSLANGEAVANRAYANNVGNNDVPSGDGWRFRGRGFKQTTGRANYRSFTQSYHLYWSDDAHDFVENPDLLSTTRYGTRSGVYYWLSHKLYAIADQTAGDGGSQIDAITALINKRTDSYSARRENFRKIISARVFGGIGN